jgi:N-acyl-D-amino-acid deacylase
VVKIDGRPSPPDILNESLISEMTSNGATLCPDGSCFYAGGWVVRPVGSGATWSHGGDLPGTKANLVRSYYNISYAVLFNTSAPNSLLGELDAALWQALNSMTSFPAQDLFETFP